MVRLVVNRMCLHHPNPYKSQATAVVSRIIHRYTECFQDRTDQGELLGNGYHSLTTQLKCHIEHLNGFNVHARLRSPQMKRVTDDSPNVPCNNLTDSYRCVQWQPDLPDGGD